MNNYLYKCNWEAGYFCKECDHELSYKQIMYSIGVCPYCGYSCDSTIVSHTIKVRRWVVTKKTFRGWWWGYKTDHKGYWEYKDESHYEPNPLADKARKMSIGRK